VEGILAVVGFWVCMIAIVMKKPFMAYIEQTKVQQTDASRLMDARVRELEGAVTSLGLNMTELKDSTEFAHKMIIESSKKLADSHQLLLERSLNLIILSKCQMLLKRWSNQHRRPPVNQSLHRPIH
jgi:hypothetical protein